jgi:ribose transport system ATP-binding protein
MPKTEVAPLLEATHVRKQYGSVVALADASITIRPGEVMALLGQNGAGKSTLVGILSGRVRSDAGQLSFDGQAISGHELARQGSPVAVVQQELSLVPTMTVGQNVFLANLDIGRVYGERKAARMARPYLAKAGLGDLDPLTPAGRLSVGEQQLVELARALARNARLLILDEPTAALSEPEIARVLAVVRDLKAQGVSVLYISHRLNEVIEIADRATIVRDGRSLEAIEGDEMRLERIIELMLGRKLEALYPSGERVVTGEEVLRLENVTAAGIDRPVSLKINRGEIHGLAGQLGSAAGAVIEVIAGVRPLTGGTIFLHGEPVAIGNPRRAKAEGIAYCSGDRKLDGIFGVRSVQDNLSAPGLSSVAWGGWILPRRERALAQDLAGAFAVTSGRMPYPVESLSGGNQQKVVLGKWLGIQPSVLLINEPTRGVDVGARSDIYAHLQELADGGLTILFTSSEADEVIGLADVVSSFFRGTFVRTRPARDLSSGELEHELSTAPALVETMGNR